MYRGSISPVGAACLGRLITGRFEDEFLVVNESLKSLLEHRSNEALPPSHHELELNADQPLASVATLFLKVFHHAQISAIAGGELIKSKLFIQADCDVILGMHS